MGSGLENLPVEKAVIILIERFDNFMRTWHEKEEVWQQSRLEHKAIHESLEEDHDKFRKVLFGNGEEGLVEKVRTIEKGKWTRQDWLTVIGLLVGSGIFNMVILHFIK